MQSPIEIESIRFRTDETNSFLSNKAYSKIRFWIDGAFYTSDSIETAYLGIQGYIPHKGDWQNDNDTNTPTRKEAQKFFSNKNMIIDKTQFQNNVPDMFHSPMSPEDLSTFNLVEGLNITLKEQLMYELLLIKSTQNTEIFKILLATTNKEIIADACQEDEPENSFWGNPENALGKAWMRVRETLQNELNDTGSVAIRRGFSDGLMCYYFGMMDRNKIDYQNYNGSEIEEIIKLYYEYAAQQTDPSVIHCVNYSLKKLRDAEFSLQLKIELPIEEIKTIFAKTGVIQLRRVDTSRKLLLGCGNTPCSSSLSLEHSHENFITINPELGMNPCVVGAFGFNDGLNKVLPKDFYEELYGERVKIAYSSGDINSNTLECMKSGFKTFELGDPTPRAFHKSYLFFNSFLKSINKLSLENSAPDSNCSNGK